MCAQIFFAPSKIAIFEYHLNPIYDINTYRESDGEIVITMKTDIDFDDGLDIFKFTSAEFSDITAFSGNNPGVI